MTQKSDKKGDGGKRSIKVKAYINATKVDAPRCPECNSTQVRFRIKDNTIVCQRCGAVTKLEVV